MKVSKFQKKGMLIGVILMLVGTAVFFTGYGMAGFEPDNMQVKGMPKWYQTLHMSDTSFWVGIRYLDKDKNAINIISMGGWELK